MLQLLTTAGGVALILFAIRFLRKGLDRLFGPRLGDWMRQLADSRWRAFLTGVGVSVLAPSSTTMSLLAVHAVQERQLSVRQMFAVVLGADVGLTVMVLLISLRMDAYAPILLLIGVVLFQFTHASRSRGIGQVMIAVGFIFMAIGIIKTAATSSAPSDHFKMLIEAAGFYPLVLALIIAALTVAVQSSTATIGLVIALGAAGVVDLNVALAAVVGANVGIALNTLMVGWRQIDSRRLALANLLAKLAIAAAVLALLPQAAKAASAIPGGMDKQTALSHCAFNIATAALFLPLIGPMMRLVAAITPSSPVQETQRFGPRYLSEATGGSLALALGQSMREILRVSEIVRSMLEDAWRALRDQDEALARQVQERDDQVDLLDAEIKKYLAALASTEGERDERGEIMRQMRYLNELETIGDLIDKNLAELAVKRATQQVRFSNDGWAELEDFYSKVRENVLIAENAFHSRDPVLAQRLLRHKDRLSEEDRVLRDRHFARLRQGETQTHESSAIHLDVLTHLKRINSCVTHVAYALVEQK